MPASSPGRCHAQTSPRDGNFHCLPRPALPGGAFFAQGAMGRWVGRREAGRRRMRRCGTPTALAGPAHRPSGRQRKTGFNETVETRFEWWSERRDSNSRPSAPKADALPGCATLRQPALYPEFGGDSGDWGQESNRIVPGFCTQGGKINHTWGREGVTVGGRAASARPPAPPDLRLLSGFARRLGAGIGPCGPRGLQYTACKQGVKHFIASP